MLDRFNLITIIEFCLLLCVFFAIVYRREGEGEGGREREKEREEKRERGSFIDAN